VLVVKRRLVMVMKWGLVMVGCVQRVWGRVWWVLWMEWVGFRGVVMWV
jgi:hypothetical protein